MNKEIIVQLSYPLPPPPPPTDSSKQKKPKMGFSFCVFSGLVIFVAAIVYLVAGNLTAGIVGIVFVVISLFFARKGYLAIDKKDRTMFGMVPMFIGFLVMIADNSLLGSDLVVLFGGFLLAIGGILISSGK